MATDKQVVRKNGIPVKRFWQEKITAKQRAERYTTTYPIYFHGHGDTVWALIDEKAPRSLDEAMRIARMMVQSPDQPMTQANIYEMRAVGRVGTEFDWKLHTREQEVARIKEVTDSRLPDFTLVATTSQP
jgi:hypothetical protein